MNRDKELLHAMSQMTAIAGGGSARRAAVAMQGCESDLEGPKW